MAPFWVSLTRSSAEIHALLLSDVVVLLQEKDQKLVFAAVVSFLPTDVLDIALLLHLLLFQSCRPLTFLIFCCVIFVLSGQQTTYHFP